MESDGKTTFSGGRNYEYKINVVIMLLMQFYSRISDLRRNWLIIIRVMQERIQTFEKGGIARCVIIVA